MKNPFFNGDKSAPANLQVEFAEYVNRFRDGAAEKKRTKS